MTTADARSVEVPTGGDRRAVLVLAARADDRAARVAEALRAVLDGGGDAGRDVVVTHAVAPDLESRLVEADRVYVLDPGWVRALWARLTAPRSPLALVARLGVLDRIALFDHLQGHPGTVRWVTRPAQLAGLG